MLNFHHKTYILLLTMAVGMKIYYIQWIFKQTLILITNYYLFIVQYGDVAQFFYWNNILHTRTLASVCCIFVSETKNKQ